MKKVFILLCWVTFFPSSNNFIFASTRGVITPDAEESLKQCLTELARFSETPRNGFALNKNQVLTLLGEGVTLCSQIDSPEVKDQASLDLDYFGVLNSFYNYQFSELSTVHRILSLAKKGAPSAKLYVEQACKCSFEKILKAKKLKVLEAIILHVNLEKNPGHPYR